MCVCVSTFVLVSCQLNCHLFLAIFYFHAFSLSLYIIFIFNNIVIFIFCFLFTKFILIFLVCSKLLLQFEQIVYKQQIKQFLSHLFFILFNFLLQAILLRFCCVLNLQFKFHFLNIYCLQYHSSIFYYAC